ncbi:hypothetical protein E2C01_083985 [Portunus trituberculatus]|uniref:Uncharacterized protein n=1 Tax=Portunus trituberculatus TaxID=210409 RepID=A0A5B7J690_PORTR|nr:hypothetical protein [Portunus trituberculatus]
MTVTATALLTCSLSSPTISYHRWLLLTSSPPSPPHHHHPSHHIHNMLPASPAHRYTTTTTTTTSLYNHTPLSGGSRLPLTPSGARRGGGGLGR